MSRSDEFIVNTPKPEDKPEARTVQERAAEITDRLGLTREAAHREMERFRNLAEYETRKIFGQRSALRDLTTPEPKRKKSHRDSTGVEYHAEKSAGSSRKPEPDSEDPQQKLALE